MKSLKASMEGEWFGLTCGYVCARLLSAKTLTSRGSPWWILGSGLSDSLRILRQMKSVTFEQSSPNVWGEEKKRERKREWEKKKNSHLLFLPSASVSTHSIIRVAPSDCLRSSLYHPAKAVLLQLAFKTDNKKRKTIHLGFFIRKNLWGKKRSIACAGTNNPCAIWLSKTRGSSQVSTWGGLISCFYELQAFTKICVVQMNKFFFSIHNYISIHYSFSFSSLQPLFTQK